MVSDNGRTSGDIEEALKILRCSQKGRGKAEERGDAEGAVRAGRQKEPGRSEWCGRGGWKGLEL